MVGRDLPSNFGGCSLLENFPVFKHYVLQCGISGIECGDQNQFLVIINLVLESSSLTQSQRTGPLIGIIKDVIGIPVS